MDRFIHIFTLFEVITLTIKIAISTMNWGQVRCLLELADIRYDSVIERVARIACSNQFPLAAAFINKGLIRAVLICARGGMMTFNDLCDCQIGSGVSGGTHIT